MHRQTHSPPSALAPTIQPLVAEEARSTAQTKPSGPLIAASLSVLFAIFTLMVTHHLSRLTPELERAIFAFGAWIPWAHGEGPGGNIGSYGGKETLALWVWAASWVSFHLAWRRLDFDLRRWLWCFTAALALLTLGFFHPLADPIVLVLARWFGVIG
ncbi:MAG: hypothetical protein N3A55_03580 [Methylohalobius sp.]|nr:hypothetical protein [Methylohalobius sp.]